MNHIDPSTLDTYAVGPGRLPADAADRLEDHVLVCESCRARVARSTSVADMDRSWAAIERRLRGDPSSQAGALDDAGVSLDEWTTGPPDGHARRRVGQPALAAAALVMFVAGLAWVFQVRQQPEPSATMPGWNVGRPDDEATFTSPGDLLGIAALLEWHDELLVVGAVQAADGQRNVAWTSTGEGRWTNRTIDFPVGCDPWGGIAVVGEELAIGCVRRDLSSPTVSVATTRDLDTWTVHDVGSVSSSFGVIIGSDGSSRVSLAVLEAADPNTTQGARLRVWVSDDLSSWDQLPGSGKDVLTDAFAQRIRLFDGDIVIVGAVNTWPDASTGAAGQIPAVWVSRGGTPFSRHLLPDESGGPAGGYAHDITATDGGYAAVGGTDGLARAWFSEDLDTWDIGVVTDPEVLGPTGAGAMWTVAAAGTDLVAASVGDPTAATPTWSSRDGGHTWHPAGDGPSIVLSLNQAVVGVRTTAPVGLWRLDLR
ncbi:MAG: hypothetical protein E4H05_00835 [Acidimicrobiales bacterium]|nr:MAG: hypothetical protein E4H05_00835 [Acidimicrobiales bacterium]